MGKKIVILNLMNMTNWNFQNYLTIKKNWQDILFIDTNIKLFHFKK